MRTLKGLCETEHVTIASTVSDKPAPWEGSNGGEHGWRCKLGYQGRSLTVDFWTGSAHYKDPTAADVLACLCSDVASVYGTSLESWCADLGFDVDSRKAEQIYRACVALSPRVRRFLGASFDVFARAEH